MKCTSIKCQVAFFKCFSCTFYIRLGKCRSSCSVSLMEKIYQRFLVTRCTPFPRHSAGREQWLMFFTSSELYPVGWEKAKPGICSSAELLLQVKTPIMAHVLHRVLNKEWELWVPLINTGLQKDKGQIYTAGVASGQEGPSLTQGSTWSQHLHVLQSPPLITSLLYFFQNAKFVS